MFYYRKLLYSCNTDEAQLADIKSQWRIPRFNGIYWSHTGPYDAYLLFQTTIQCSLHRMSWVIFPYPRLEPCVSNNPCHHPGPCSNSSSCPCFKNQSHCQRNCHCSPECKSVLTAFGMNPPCIGNRRWKGCRCSKVRSRWSCATERCPCVESLRECDPELCINCRCMWVSLYAQIVL